MRKGNLLLCGIVAVAMLAPSCQAIAPDVEYKRLPAELRTFIKDAETPERL